MMCTVRSMGSNSQWGFVNVVSYLDGGGFDGKSQYLIFDRMEFHFFLSSKSEGCRGNSRV